MVNNMKKKRKSTTKKVNKNHIKVHERPFSKAQYEKYLNATKGVITTPLGKVIYFGVAGVGTRYRTQARFEFNKEFEEVMRDDFERVEVLNWLERN